ncbi:MAG: carbon storage regulator CsrA [Chitinispirillales bacterium]|jgi:carbon storage regulator|nr:carbon storage regulator CsrA [Chitinispirillales bacterium]
MLVLTRKKEEMIRIDGNITIKIIDIDNRQVKLGIDAPRHIAVNREEVYQRILAANKAASEESVHEDGLLAIAGMLKNTGK